MANPNIVNVTDIRGESVGWNLTATPTTTLMTVSSDKLIKINRMTVANVDGTNAADVTVYIDKVFKHLLVQQLQVVLLMFTLPKQFLPLIQ